MPRVEYTNSKKNLCQKRTPPSDCNEQPIEKHATTRQAKLVAPAAKRGLSSLPTLLLPT